ncbi:MAG: sulfotransferase [Pseudomonadota bacterium]
MKFTDLIAPMELETFADKFNKGERFVIRGAPDKFEGLITLDEIETRMNDGCNVSSPLEIIHDGKRQALVDKNLSWAGLALQKTRISQLLEQRHSFLMMNMSQINPRVGELIDTVERTFASANMRADLHLYISPDAGASAYNAHRDYPQHKIYLQVIGKTRWQVFKTRSDLSLDIRAFEAKDEAKHLELEKEFVLNPGDMFYMPPAVFHKVHSVDGPRVSFSIPFNQVGHDNYMDRRHIPFKQIFLDALNSQSEQSSAPAEHPFPLKSDSISRPAFMDQPCPCNSGSLYGDCCGRLAESVGERRHPNSENYRLYDDICTAIRENRWLHCAHASSVLLQREPYHKGALRSALQVKRQKKRGIEEDGDAIARRLSAGFPTDAQAQYDAAEYYLSAHNLTTAREHYQKVVKLKPNHFAGHDGLARTFSAGHAQGQAELHYRRALQLQPDSAAVATNLGVCLSSLGQKSAAEHYFKIATALQPHSGDTYLKWSRMEESRSKLRKARTLFNRAKKHIAEPGRLAAHESRLLRREGKPEQALESLNLADPKTMDPRNRAIWLMEKGVCLDQLRQYDDAFRAFSEANSIHRDQLGMKYDFAKHRQLATAQSKFFSRKKVRSLQRLVQDEQQATPIFILGFTRSGTTMAEQIISYANGVAGGDELHLIHTMIKQMPELLNRKMDFPVTLQSAVDDPSASDIQTLRHFYFNGVKSRGIIEPGVTAFTDKTPMNELHLGLIASLFPDAQLIHIVRHPLDSVLSTFFTNANHGEFCAYDLKSAARHYALAFKHAEMMQNRLDLPVLRVKYEDLVQRPKTTARQAFRHLGIEWRDRYLEFHRNPRFPRTASYAQVKQKTYKTSLFRHRHYRSHLVTVEKILLPAIEALGYQH